VNTLHKIHSPKVQQRGGKWVVYDTDGHVYGRHPSKGEAEAQLRALYANKDDDMSDLTKGDVPGHEFHGNQYTGSGGDKEYAAESDRRTAAEKASAHASAMSQTANARKPNEADRVDIHAQAAKAHYEAFNAHLSALRNASLAHNVRYHFEAGAHHQQKYVEHMKAAGKLDAAGNYKTKADELSELTKAPPLPTLRKQAEMLPGPIMTGAPAKAPPAPTMFKLGARPVADKLRQLRKQG
jgi:hypothetical protein